METYRKLFEFADGATLEKLLEREPDFPYDDEIVQTLTKRTDLANCDALLNVFAKKKEGIEEQLDVFDFVVTCDRDDNKQPTCFYLEYFKKFNGFYTQQRYDLSIINGYMLQKSTLPPHQLFVRAIEESEYTLTRYDKLSDYCADVLNDRDIKILFSHDIPTDESRVIDCQKFQFYYICPKDPHRFIPIQRPYTIQDIRYDFHNRKLVRNSSYPLIYHQNQNDNSKLDNVRQFLQNNGIQVNLIQRKLSFYLRKLLMSKLLK